MYINRAFFNGSIAAATTTDFTKTVDFTPAATLRGVYISGVFENADTGIIEAKVQRIFGDAPTAWTTAQKTTLLADVILPTGTYASSLYIPLPAVKLDRADTLQIIMSVKNSNASLARTYYIGYETTGE